MTSKHEGLPTAAPLPFPLPPSFLANLNFIETATHHRRGQGGLLRPPLGWPDAEPLMKGNLTRKTLGKRGKHVFFNVEAYIWAKLSCANLLKQRFCPEERSTLKIVNVEILEGRKQFNVSP